MAKLDAHERLVTHHSITIDTQFRTQIDEKTKQQCICPVPEMTQLAPLIIETIGLHHRYERGDVILTLQDARLYSSREDSVPTHIALMVNAVDKNGSATVLKNTETKSRMEFSPKYDEGEGYEVSAHIAICLSGEKRTYDMAYTPIPGISTGRMNSFLDRVLFKISKDHERDFTYSSPTYLVDPQ
ncbi:hypothetical protein SOK14_004235, partial [Cronobacter turicensis]|nr:hypothetical protein [Cronobacter turicensis]